MRPNEAIRKSARAAGIPLWRIAADIGVSEPTITRWLRVPLQRTLARLATDRPAEVRHVKTSPEGGETYIIPKGWLKIRASRIMTDEQRRELAERLRKSNLSAETP